MKTMSLNTIGRIRIGSESFRVEVDKAYRAGLEGLEAFGWVQILWWAHQAEEAQEPGLFCARPYTGGPERLGIFATRTVCRPNPIGLSVAQITDIDMRHGILSLAWVDGVDGTPVLDLKPYHPSMDRVEAPRVPAWCAHWPSSVEASATFDWGTVFSA